MLHRNGVHETDIDSGYLEVALTKHGKGEKLSVKGNVRTMHLASACASASLAAALPTVLATQHRATTVRGLRSAYCICVSADGLRIELNVAGGLTARCQARSPARTHRHGTVCSKLLTVIR